MADLGFWRLAEADPGRVALVGPDGTEHTAGDVVGRANQLARGLRTMGLSGGDTVAVLMPNGTELIELGARRAIRVGTCGALSSSLELDSPPSSPHPTSPCSCTSAANSPPS